MINCIKILHIFLVTFIRLLCPGGRKSIIAENVALRQQLILLGKNRQRAPNLSYPNRLLFGFIASFIKPHRLQKIAIIISPSTPLKFHQALVKKKYSLIFSHKSKGKPDPKGPTQELINLIVEMKRKNPYYGCRRIAMQITNYFNCDIDKDVVRRVLSKHYKPNGGDNGPSWLTFLGHMKDSLWSLDLFCCESLNLTTYWVMVVMDQHTRKIIGMAVNKGHIDGLTACIMFSKITKGKNLPIYLSTDNDPIFTFSQWKKNLDILEIKEIKSLPCQPRSHPFIERLIGTIRCELLNRVMFWTGDDLLSKLNNFMEYYNFSRCHHGINKKTPHQKSSSNTNIRHSLDSYSWKYYCRGLFALPI
jgi:putative transposase